MMPASPLLLAAIAIEGYVVLAVELIAIRQLTPYVGNGTDTVAIVIAAVLLPLAFGYEAGGRTGLAAGDEAGVRGRLVRNLLVAALVLALGLSHPFLAAFFAGLDGIGATHRLVQAALHAGVFLVVPVYLLGQTLPLVAVCVTGADLPRTTGLMLFLSTLGSFLGSVASTLVLMSLWGVHVTVALTLGLLVGLAGTVAWGGPGRAGTLAAAGVLGLFIAAVNSPAAMRAHGIVSDNLHSQVRIHPNPVEDSRLLVVNNSPSSKVAARPEDRFAYVRAIEGEVIGRLDRSRPHRILVIGAGGFTLGLEDTRNLYTYVDIDPALKAVSEEHFLPAPLGPNKAFVAESARAFLRRVGEPFDVVVLDAYTNRLALPGDLVTREAFAAARAATRPGGQVALNVVASPDFADRFSRSIDATIRSVFPFATRDVLPGTEAGGVASVLYRAGVRADEAFSVYTDDRNRSFLDQ